jgi:hypothetical protein
VVLGIQRRPCRAPNTRRNRRLTLSLSRLLPSFPRPYPQGFIVFSACSSRRNSHGGSGFGCCHGPRRFVNHLYGPWLGSRNERIVVQQWISTFSVAVRLGAPAFFIGGFHFGFGPLRVALCSNDTLRVRTRLAVLQQGVRGRFSAGSLSRSHNHTRPMRRPPAGRHRKHDSHSLSSRQTILRTAAYCKPRNSEGYLFFVLAHILRAAEIACR